MPRLVPRREVSAREPGAGLTRPPNGEWVRVRMSSPLRAAVFAGCALLWLSGAVWLVVHLTLEQPTPFGPLPSPWEPLLLKVHGLLAVVGVFLLGWIMADHLTERRALGRNYRSGVLLAGTAALLVLTGYALYYTTGRVHEVAARTHDFLGVGSLLLALAHWWRARPAR
ncbi:MAG: hypothetical protein E6K32_18760 [Gammaproteobacteria bacterium]|nr:MAG: hypothetical protein E6K32_18760 [Gammaproteobacteria bacterium]